MLSVLSELRTPMTSLVARAAPFWSDFFPLPLTCEGERKEIGMSDSRLGAYGARSGQLPT
jgi:hypothetical protein